ncbi:MAG: Hpt domain-containing protein [Arenicellales bacterium]|nr:Hpt domain-containing protein [Arenicellales bacterium]
MASLGTVESGTLDWVKTEIDQTLGQAREALNEFVAHKDDLTPLRMYVNHLHQVVGTLQMVELDGAAMLAKETESLADEVIHNGLEHDGQKVVSLLDSSLQDLSAYLDKLQKGMADMPIHNLQSMNALRQARGEGPIEIFSIFTPDLEVYPPKPDKREKLEDAEYRDRIGQIRKQFQVALLRWLRDTDNEALSTLGELTSQLQNIARFNSVAQLWWVARGYIEILADDSSELGMTQKHVPARLDQLLRKLIEGGEAAIAKDRDENLIKQMLYDIGVSSSDSAVVKEIQHAFNLSEIIRGETIEQPLKDIPPTLGQELEAELGSIKENITDYFESVDRDPERLDQIVQGLRSIATRVEQEDSSNLVELITEVVNVLNLAGTQLDGMDENAIALQVAESLILLEEILKSKSDLVEDWPQSVNEKVEGLRNIREHSADATDAAGLKVARLATADMKSLLPVVANEIYVNLHAAEEALEAFSRRPEETTPLEGVPDNLAQVQGALQILGQHKAADMLSTANDYLKKLISKELEPTHALIDSLAVAIVTAQSFVEGLEKDRPYTREMVDRAIQDLEDVLTERELINFDPAQAVNTLREHLEKWLSDNANYAAFRQLRQSIKEISAVASIRNLSKPRRIAREMNNLLDIVTDDPSFLSEEVGHTLRRSLDTLEELVVDLEASVTAQEESAIEEGVEEELEVQTEILEIFREEAEECTENIDRFFSIWRDDTTNESALIDLRRQFHTLKGSGRTANVGPFAELAWIVEHLLNQVIDRKLAVSDGLLSLVSDAKQAIVELLKDKAFGASWLDLPAWEARSKDLLEGEKKPPLNIVEIAKPAVEEKPEQEADRPSDISAGAKLDDAVIRIFTQETLGHINTIRDFLSNSSNIVSPELLRAVHTLRGTSRSLHLVEMSNVFLALDEHLNSIYESGELLSQRELDLLDKAALLSAKTLDRLNTDRTFPATLRSEFDGLREVIASCRRPDQGLSEEDDISALGRLVSQQEPQTTPVREAGGVTGDAALEDDALIDLKNIFCEESIDVLTRINNVLDEWRDGQEEAVVIPKIKRDLHTLKGSARTAGYDAIGDLSHLTETLLEKEEKGFSIEENLLRVLLEEVHDTLSEMINQVEQGETVKEAIHLKQRMSELVMPHREGPSVSAVDDTAQTIEKKGLRTKVAVNVSTPAAIQPGTGVGTELSLDADKEGEEVESGRNVLRVNTDVLDKLVNYAGEVSITRAQMQEQLGGLRSNLVELRGNISRFTEQLRRLELQSDSQIRSRIHEQQAQVDSDRGEFDPLQLDRYTELQQLSRSLSESLDDLVTIQSDISKIVHQSESVMQQQAQLSAELQNGLMGARLVPFSTLIPKLRHQTRQTARELHKEAELRMTGGSVEIDRKVLDGMAEALDHMIRNALYHGIEDPGHRKARGKPKAGTILVECKHQGNEAIIRFSDDGAGLNVDEIRSKAIHRGLIRDKASLSDQEIIQLIVLPGFSTAAEVTQVSGRGVGMDVVHNAVRRLGGSITVESEPGEGTAFVIVLPLSLSITQAIFVRCGSQEFAVSLNVIQNVVKVDRKELESMSQEGQAVFERDGRVYPLMDLSRRLNIMDELDNQERVPILIVRMGATEVAVKVGKLMGTQEVVVKSLGSHIAHMEGIAGATIRGNGAVVLILDLTELWLADHEHRDVTEEESVPVEAPPAPPLIMVVDDSLTVRKVTARNLSRHGMEVVMAKDGVDALDHINKRLPDLMLVDIEMPRMDGYELTRQIRSDPATKNIPIVIITSRAGKKHKKKALSLGANDYLTKPYQEDELVSHVEACLSQAKVVRA